MVAIIGASVFSVVIILSILIICGLPLGELTMGGQYKIFPKKLRFILAGQLILQIFFVIIILQIKYGYEFYFQKQKRKIFNDAPFCNFSNMFLDNGIVSNDLNDNLQFKEMLIKWRTI